MKNATKLTFEQYEKVMKLINGLNVGYINLVWTSEDTLDSFKEKALISLKPMFGDDITKNDLQLKSKGEGIYDVWCGNIGGIIVERIEKIVDVELEYYDFNTRYEDSDLNLKQAEVEKIVVDCCLIDIKKNCKQIFIHDKTATHSFNTSCNVYQRIYHKKNL